MAQLAEKVLSGRMNHFTPWATRLKPIGFRGMTVADKIIHSTRTMFFTATISGHPAGRTHPGNAPLPKFYARWMKTYLYDLIQSLPTAPIISASLPLR
jgi:hypothetical protein